MNRYLLRAMPKRIRPCRFQSNINNNHSKTLESNLSDESLENQPQIHLTNKDIYSERPLGVLSSKDFTLILLHGALQESTKMTSYKVGNTFCTFFAPKKFRKKGTFKKLGLKYKKWVTHGFQL